MKFRGLGHAVSAKSADPLPAPVSGAHRFHGPEYLCELVGTAIMVFVGLSAVAIDFGAGSPMLRWVPSPHGRLLITAFFFSGGGTAVVYSYLGQRSGGHLNPAVTFAFWLMGKLPAADALAYIVCQLIGATAGAALVWRVWTAWAVSTHLAITHPGAGLTWAAAFAAETLMTFLLIVAIFSGLKSDRWSHYTGLFVGALVVGLVYVGAPISGTSLNPARSTGPALVTGVWRDLWIYWVAPTLGAALGVLIFKAATKKSNGKPTTLGSL